MSNIQSNVNYQGRTPKNFKRGTLILGKYTPLGLGALIVAFLWFIGGMLLMMTLFEPNILWALVILIPPIITIILLLPNNRYHNFGTKLLLTIRFNKKDKYFSNLIKEGKKR